MIALGVLTQFTDSLILIAEGHFESVCVQLVGAELGRSVTLSLQLNTNEGTVSGN